MSNGTKIPAKYSAQDRGTFAYTTIKDRLPVILVKTIDSFHRNRTNLLGLTSECQRRQWNLVEVNGEEIESDVKEVISQVAKLRQALETNKPAELFSELDLSPEVAHFNEDIGDWNKALNENLTEEGSLPRWFDSPWLLMEAYMYRRIKDIMLRTRRLKQFDVFIESKRQAHQTSVPQMVAVGNYLLDVVKSYRALEQGEHPSERVLFGTFVQLALWANKCDLSINCMGDTPLPQADIGSNIRESVEQLRANILCDNSSQLWDLIHLVRTRGALSNVNNPTLATQPIYIDLVADNVGFEIYVDLCLLHYLTLFFKVDENQTSRVKFRIHVKRMSWFVSDVMKCDVDYLLEFLDNQADQGLRTLSKQWRKFFDSGLWEVQDDKYWTLPYDYSQMQAEDPQLYEKLSQSSLIVFKGDLNYRKLTGDRKWHFLTPFVSALCGFKPANLVALRTVKADVVAGIEDTNIYARINNNELPKDWMISGNYGLIQVIDLH